MIVSFGKGKRIKKNNKMPNLKALPAKDLEIESRLLSTPPLEAVQSALKKVRFKKCESRFLYFRIII